MQRTDIPQLLSNMWCFKLRVCVKHKGKFIFNFIETEFNHTGQDSERVQMGSRFLHSFKVNVLFSRDSFSQVKTAVFGSVQGSQKSSPRTWEEELLQISLNTINFNHLV